MGNVRVRQAPNHRFGIVPDLILENKKLSLPARLVAAWLAGRQPNFEIRVEALREQFLGIGEAQWKSIRRELEVAGWWRSERTPGGERGRFVWNHEFSYVGFDDAPPDGNPAFPPIRRCPTGGQSIDGQVGDNHTTTESTSMNLTTTTTTTTAGTPGGGEIEDMVEAAFWQQSRVEPPRNPSGWLVRVRRRMEEKGITSEDRQTHQRWKRFLSVQKQAEQKQAERAVPSITGQEAVEKAEALLSKLKKPGGGDG